MKSIHQKLVAVATLTVSMIMLSTAAFSAIIPSGVQSNITTTQFNSWGLTQCYSEAEFGGPESIMSVIKQECNYDYVGYGLFNANTSVYESLAVGAFDYVFRDNGNIFRQRLSSSYNVSNNVNFFYYANGSAGGMGFYDTNSTAQPQHCDTDINSQKDAMCMHLRSGTLGEVDTYTIGDVWATTTSGSRKYIFGSEYSIRFFGADVNAVPESSVFALMMMGILTVFGVARRRA